MAFTKVKYKMIDDPPAGVQGSIGSQGGIGSSIQGAQGIIGTSIQGSIGSQGNIGTSVQGSIGTSIQGSIGTSIQGSIGSQGNAGSQGTVGTSIQGSQGIIGTSIQGAQGVIGSQGNIGSQGQIGTSIQGSQGIIGTSIQGSIGSQGNIGTSVQGSVGTSIQGSQGIIGTSIQGSQGLLGTQGITGTATQGVQGTLGTQGTTNTIIDSTPDSDHLVNGLTTVLTAGTALSFGQVCYMGSDGKMELGDADAVANSGVWAMCADASISENATGNFLLIGIARDDTWNWGTLGGFVYLDTATAGGMTQTAPSATDDVIQICGIAIHADYIYFNPQLVMVEHT